MRGPGFDEWSKVKVSVEDKCGQQTGTEGGNEAVPVTCPWSFRR